MDFGKLVRDLGDTAGKATGKAVEAAGSAASSIKEGVEAIDVEDVQKKVFDAAGHATSALKDVTGKAAEALGDASAAAASALKTNALKTNSREQECETSPQEARILAVGAVRSLYYLMAADGEISSEEKEWFDSIGESLVTDYASAKDDVREGCIRKVESLDSCDNRTEAAADLIEAEIFESSTSEGEALNPYLFAWNMFVMANRDGRCCDSERTVIERAVEALGLDRSRVAELECAVVTLREIEEEADWLKASDRPYSEIAPIIDELETRRNVVFASAHSLIAL